MKILNIFIIILVIILLGGVIYYFTMPKDKCANVTCLSGQECNSNTGKCEPTSQTPMDRIEKAIDDKLDSLPDTSTLNGMDKIENAINAKLNR